MEKLLPLDSWGLRAPVFSLGLGIAHTHLKFLLSGAFSMDLSQRDARISRPSPSEAHIPPSVNPLWAQSARKHGG